MSDKYRTPEEAAKEICEKIRPYPPDYRESKKWLTREIARIQIATLEEVIRLWEGGRHTMLFYARDKIADLRAVAGEEGKEND